MKWIILLLGISANASASVLVKLASTHPYRMPRAGDLGAALTNWPLLLGVFLYGVAFILYTLSLTRLPLSVAHPILTAGAVVAVAVSSSVLFKENFDITKIVGIFLVLAGVLLITRQTA